MYGTTLHLPGAFSPDSTPPDVTDTTSYVSRLKLEMNKLQATVKQPHISPIGLLPFPFSLSLLRGQSPSRYSTRRGLVLVPQLIWQLSLQVYSPLFLVEKRPGQPLMATNGIFVTDRTSSLRFLVETGAEVSVIPPLSAHCTPSHAGVTLQAVNNTSITINLWRTLSHPQPGTPLHLPLGVHCG